MIWRTPVKGSDMKYNITNTKNVFSTTAVVTVFTDTLILFIAKSNPSDPNRISKDAVQYALLNKLYCVPEKKYAIKIRTNLLEKRVEPMSTK